MFSTPQVKQSGTSLHVEHGNDSNLYVEFTMEAIHQTFESAREGRPIFKDVPHIRIMFAGDKTKVVFRPVEEQDKHRFAPQWAAFERQEEQVQSGTPVTEWSPLTKSEAMELKSMNIHTVEALANLPDSGLNWLGGREMRNKAQKYLEVSKDSAVLTKMAAENSKLQADIDALKEQIKQLAKPNKKES
jgi:hypothetical protein